jgi:rod shape-determining protein MreD
MIGVILVILLVAAALGQDFMPGILILGQVKAPFLLAVALYYALAHSRPVFLWAAILGGILQDSLSLVPIGYSAMVYSLLGLAVRHFREVLFTRSAGTAALVGGAANLVAQGVIQILLWLGGEWGGGSWGGTLIRLAGAGLLGLVATPVVWWVARSLDERVGNVPLETVEI